MNKDKGTWIESPFTGKTEVMVESDDKQGERKMCIGSGYFTNEFPLNYKKHPDFDIERYESSMPKLMKALRFDDGESYWYPTTIRTDKGMVFPAGESEKKWAWAYAPVIELKEGEELEGYSHKLDMEKAEYFERFLEAARKINGYTLDEVSS